MMHEHKAILGKLLLALLIGLAGAISTLLLLSQGASARLIAQRKNALAISQSQRSDHIQAGAQQVYTLTYQNASTSTIVGVVITNTLDPRVAYISASPQPTGGLPDAPYWSAGSLSASMHGEIVLTVTVADPLADGTVLTNTAAIDGHDTAPESCEITTTFVIPTATTGALPPESDDVDATSPTSTLTPQYEGKQSGTFSDTKGPAVTNLLAPAAVTLTLTKNSDPDPVPSGAPLTYTLSYANIGDTDATSVTITDVLDSRVTYISASPEPTDWTAPTLYWDLGSLISTTSGEIVISTTVQGGLSEGTTLTNTATIDSQDTAPLSTTQTTSVLAHSAPVSVTLTPTTATTPAGQSIAYTLLAHDAFGNDWTATNSATYTITTGAGGAWETNIYTAEKDGTWTITGTYESRADTATLTVTNVAPTAVISGPTAGNEGETLAFDAGLSHDPGNDIESYEWDWDYTTFSADAGGITATHEYADDGVYTLALQVTDDDGASNVATATVTIANVAPIVDAGSDRTVTETDVVSFTGSFTDPGADTHSIEWDFGDGASIAGVLTPTHVYTEPGSFNVTLTVTDDDEGIGSDDLTVTVQNLPPTVDAGGPYSGTAGTSVPLTASGSDPGGGPVTYAWDLDNDGQYDDAIGAAASFTRTVSGTYTVAVQVTDSQFAEDTATAQVIISPAELDHIVLSPSTSEIQAGETQPYTVEAFDEYDNNRGDVTSESDFIIVESGDGGTWVDNVYTSANYGDWTVQATHTDTIVATDTASLLVLSPDLHIEKSADLESVEAGAYLTYTLTYSNTGNQTATGVVITDTLDPNVDYYSASPPPSDYDSDNLYWSLPSLNPGDSDQITLSVQVHRPLPNHTILTNTAWIASLQTTPLSTTHQTTVTSRPVLTITKVDSTDPVTEGQGLRYTIVITNSGNENATGATVVEYYDPNISIISTDPPADSGSDNRRWTFDILPVDIPTEIYISSQVTAPLPVGTVLTNMVTLNTDQTGPLTATEATSVTSVSDLTIFKLDIPNKVEAGEVLQYLITYWNSGDVLARDVVITETYDSQVEFVSWESPFPITGTNNVWYIGDLPPDAGGNIVVYVRVDTPLPNNTLLTNRVTIDSLGTLPKSYTETTTVSSAPELAFSVIDDPNPVEAGDPLTYTLRYTNTGNANATDVVITATFDSNVSFVNSDPDPLDPPPSGDDQVQVWDVGTIPGEGSTGQIVIHTDVTLPLSNSTRLDFTVQLEDAQGDFLERTARTTIRSAPILSLDKSNGESSVKAGQRLTYTLTYDNSGNENAYHVIITDTLPNYVEYDGCEGCEPPGADPEAVVFHISAITQTSGQVRLFVQVEDPLTAGAEVLANTAQMTHRSLPDPIVVSDVDPIDTKPDLTILASHTPSLFAPGRLMTYTVTYGNAVESQMHAEGVNIKTTLPNGTEYVGDGWNSSDGQTYVFQIGDLLAGSTGHTIMFTVRHTDTPEISQPEFLTPFTIAQNGDVAEDANPIDNIDYVYIGVPDLIVADFTVEPIDPLPPDVPVTFTVVLKNQGTGWAWNPDNHGGSFIDVFVHEIESYPFKEWATIYTETVPIAPGAELTIVLTHDGFSEQEIREEIEAFYVKVDNYADTTTRPWTRHWGIVPEYNEWNNVSEPVSLGIEHIYLPLVVKQVGS